MSHAPNDRRTAPRPATRVGSLIASLTLGLALLAVVPAFAQSLKNGQKALEEGRYDDAVAAFRQAVADAPDDALAHLGLGQALEKKRSWNAALDSFRKASEDDPRLSEPYRGMGSCLLRLDKPAEAEAQFRKATELNRKFPDAQLGLGESLIRQKRIDEAVAVLNDGVRFGAKTAPFFYEGLGRAEAARDSLREAEVWLLKAREAAQEQQMPPSAQGEIYRSLGDLYMQRKIPSLAIQNYQQAKALDEKDLDTRMALGDAYFRGSLYNDALAEYKAVVDMNPDYAEGWLKLGNLYYLASQSDRSRVPQSIEALEKYLTLEPQSVQGQALLGQALYRRGDAEGKARARTLLSETAGKPGFPNDAWRILAISQYEGKEWAPALASFQRAPKLESIDQMRVADIMRRQAIEEPDSLRRRAYYQSADSVLARLVETDSTSAEARRAQFERGRLSYLAKDYAAAIPRFQRTIALDPKAAEAYYFLGLSQRALGDDAAGVASIQKALEIDPKQAGWWVQLGAAQAKLKQDAEAKAAFTRAAEADTGAVGAVGLQQLGYYSLVDKDYPAAVRHLEESARRDPKQVQTWVWLGQAYQNAGNRAKAVEAYRKALSLNPNEPNARKGLQQLGAP